MLTLLVLAGCTGTSRQPQLVAMDSLLLSRPDSALTLLRGMSFTDKADRMYHYLLLADACNKCYDTLPSDTILQEVADYYDRHGTPNEQVRAHYLLGCAYRDMGEAPMALQCYQQAIESADTISEDCNYAILCRIHAQAAGLFKEQYMPDEAIYELDEAMKCSQMANDSLTAMYCYENKLGALYQAGEYDSVLVNTKIVYNRYRDMGLTNRAACSLSPAIFVLIQRRELQKAKEYINIYQRYTEREDNKKNQQGMYYTYLGFYYLYSNQLDSAIYYFNLQLDYKERLNNRVLAYHGLFDTYQKANQKDSAMKYAKLYNEANDSSNIFESAERLQRMQAMYRYERNQKRATLSEHEAEINRLRMWITIGIGILILFLVIHYYKQIREKERKELIELNKMYYDTLESLNRAKDDLAMIEKENTALIEKKEKEIDNYKKLLVLYEPTITNPEKQDYKLADNPLIKSLHKKATCGKPASDSDIYEIFEIIKENYPQFLSDIEKQIGKLSYKQSCICVFSKLFFIPSEVGTLMQMRYQSVTNMRSRLAKTMIGTEATAADLDTILHTI